MCIVCIRCFHHRLPTLFFCTYTYIRIRCFWSVLYVVFTFSTYLHSTLLHSTLLHSTLLHSTLLLCCLRSCSLRWKYCVYTYFESTVYGRFDTLYVVAAYVEKSTYWWSRDDADMSCRSRKQKFYMSANKIKFHPHCPHKPNQSAITSAPISAATTRSPRKKVS